MMTLREQFLDQLVALIRQIPALNAVVDRSVARAFEIDDSDVIVVHRGKDEPNEEMFGVTDRNCEVQISIVTRNHVPERVADALMLSLHPLVMAFAHESVTDVSEGVTEAPKYGGADGKACLVTSHYFIQYRTQAGSLVS